MDPHGVGADGWSSLALHNGAKVTTKQVQVLMKNPYSTEHTEHRRYSGQILVRISCMSYIRSISEHIQISSRGIRPPDPWLLGTRDYMTYTSQIMVHSIAPTIPKLNNIPWETNKQQRNACVTNNFCPRRLSVGKSTPVSHPLSIMHRSRVAAPSNNLYDEAAADGAARSS
jgi:hypothetical protein